MFFVYRSHYDDPLSKVVRRVPDGTVLGWFRQGWDADDPDEWTTGELAAGDWPPELLVLRALALPSDDLPDGDLRAALERCNRWPGFDLDTVWAAAHPDLARSLLRYAHHWDPLE